MAITVQGRAQLVQRKARKSRNSAQTASAQHQLEILMDSTARNRRLVAMTTLVRKLFRRHGILPLRRFSEGRTRKTPPGLRNLNSVQPRCCHQSCRPAMDLNCQNPRQHSISASQTLPSCQAYHLKFRVSRVVLVRRTSTTALSTGVLLVGDQRAKVSMLSFA